MNVKVGFPGLLGLLFIGLKLTGYINWSWLWVLSPFWLPAAVVLSLAAIVGVFAVLAGAIGEVTKRAK